MITCRQSRTANLYQKAMLARTGGGGKSIKYVKQHWQCCVARSCWLPTGLRVGAATSTISLYMHHLIPNNKIAQPLIYNNFKLPFLLLLLFYRHLILTIVNASATAMENTDS